jgi:hypothetical protein
LGPKKTAFPKKKTSFDCIFNTQTTDAHPNEKTTNTKDSNTPASDLYEINLTCLVLICPTQSSTLKAPSVWISQLLSV